LKIAILGAGNLGGTLGQSWVSCGHEIFFGVPRPSNAKTQKVMTEIGAKASARGVAEAAASGEVIVLATPWPATEAAIREAGPGLRNKVVIDCTNPLKPPSRPRSTGHSVQSSPPASIVSNRLQSDESDRC
jgi:predicted dinucleotide-binding enzyme